MYQFINYPALYSHLSYLKPYHQILTQSLNANGLEPNAFLKTAMSLEADTLNLRLIGKRHPTSSV